MNLSIKVKQEISPILKKYGLELSDVRQDAGPDKLPAIQAALKEIRFALPLFSLDWLERALNLEPGKIANIEKRNGQPIGRPKGTGRSYPRGRHSYSM